MKKIAVIGGMHCEHCKKRVIASLSALNGVKKVKVDLDAKTALIEGDGFTETEIRDALSEIDFTLEEIREA